MEMFNTFYLNLSCNRSFTNLEWSTINATLCIQLELINLDIKRMKKKVISNAKCSVFLFFFICFCFYSFLFLFFSYIAWFNVQTTRFNWICKWIKIDGSTLVCNWWIFWLFLFFHFLYTFSIQIFLILSLKEKELCRHIIM